MKRVFLPFDLPVFEYIKSNHPLPVSLTIPHYDGIEFVRAAPPDTGPPLDPRRAFDQATKLLERLAAKLEGVVPRNDRGIFKFIESRDFDSQTRVDTSADLAFFHTAPVLFDQMPYVLHVENITTLFHPTLIQGECADTELRKEYIYWYVRIMLESERCRGIFTNLALTKGQIDKVFDSEVISRKTRHIPAGPYFTAEEEAKIAASFEQKAQKQEIEILFTNSWHQRPGNFFLRGGLDLVMAFLAIEQHLPNVRLILRSVWPEPLENSEVAPIVRKHPKITLLEKPMSDAEMLDLFMRADIFALDAASLHSVSILRAMYCGAACIVSDAPGYEEYVRHRETAIVMPGRRAAVSSEDPESGWLRDNFKPMFEVNADRISSLAGVLSGLCTQHEARRILGANARRSVMQQNSFAKWRDGFETMLREVLAG